MLKKEACQIVKLSGKTGTFGTWAGDETHLIQHNNKDLNQIAETAIYFKNMVYADTEDKARFKMGVGNTNFQDNEKTQTDYFCPKEQLQYVNA